MKPFRFRLEAIQVMRAGIEQTARVALARTLRSAARAEEAWRETGREERRLTAAMRNARGTTYRPAEQTAADRALGLTIEQLERADEARERANAAVIAARDEWERRRRELEVLNRLQARQQQRHREVRLAAEQRLLDECANGASRTGGGES